MQNQGQAVSSGRNQATAACDICRKRKLACDSRRPNCSRCVRRGDTCRYATNTPNETRAEALKRENLELKSQLQKVADAFKAIDSLPESATLDILRLAASAPDPVTAFLRARFNLGVSIESPNRAPKAPLGTIESMPGASSAERELQICHPSIYLTLESLNESLSKTPLPQPEPLELFFAPQPESTSQKEFSDGVDHHVTQEASEPSDPVTLRDCSDTGPFRPILDSTYRDIHLTSCPTHYWTTVTIGDTIAAEILSSYFSMDHVIMGAFDASLFLQDLFIPQSRHCSPLLFNSIMYYASKGHTYKYPSCVAMSRKFLQETLNILSRPEQVGNSLHIVPALHNIANGLFQEERPKEAIRYLSLAQQFGHKLHLYGDTERVHNNQNTMSDVELLAISSVAWGSFSLLTLWAYFIRQSLPPSDPPLLPIPSLQLRPGAIASEQAYFARCKLLLDVSGIFNHYKWQTEPVIDDITFAFAETSFRNLLRSFEGLPKLLGRNGIVPDYVAYLHVLFHSMVMDIFRPYVTSHTKLSTFSASTATSRDVFLASSRQLQDLVLHLYERPSARTFAPWLASTVYTVNATIRFNSRAVATAMLKQVTMTLLNLTSSFLTAGTTLRGLLAIALRSGVLGIADARAIQDQIVRREQRFRIAGSAKVDFVLDLDWPTASPIAHAANVDKLADDFEAQLAFNDFLIDTDL